MFAFENVPKIEKRLVIVTNFYFARQLLILTKWE